MLDAESEGTGQYLLNLARFNDENISKSERAQLDGSGRTGGGGGGGGGAGVSSDRVHMKISSLPACKY